jgi:hypothetical protein
MRTRQRGNNIDTDSSDINDTRRPSSLIKSSSIPQILRTESLSGIPNPPEDHHRGWWSLRYYVCCENDKSTDKSGNDKMKEIIIQDYSAWTLFVSLLMSVDMSALLVFTAGENFEAGSLQPSSLQYWFAVFYIIFFSAASLLSTLAAYSGVKGYNYYNGIPSALILDAIKVEKMTHPNDYAQMGLIFTFLGGLMGIFYCFDLWVGFVILVFFIFGKREYMKINSMYKDSVSRVPILKLYFNRPSNEIKSGRGWKFSM